MVEASMRVYVGCYTTPDRNGRGDGISVFQMDPGTGAWRQTHVAAGITNPSFLALHPGGGYLYCVHGGRDRISAFAVRAGTGAPRYLNTQPSGGENPVRLSVHPDGGCLVVANYTGGTIAILPIRADGALDPPREVVALTGQHGPHPVEQPGPHPHDIVFDPAGRFVAVPDKGLDRVFVFRVDAANVALRPASPPSVAARPAAGPRHIAFNPRAPYAYVVNELDSTVATYSYDDGSGRLAPLHLVSALPSDYAGPNTGAEIGVEPSGRFVYASNRGHDSIVTFAADPLTGRLSTAGWQPTLGRTPRHFALDPSGRFLYAANQASHSISTFELDPHSGRPSFTGQLVQTGSPVSIAFATTLEP